MVESIVDLTSEWATHIEKAPIWDAVMREMKEKRTEYPAGLRITGNVEPNTAMAIADAWKGEVEKVRIKITVHLTRLEKEYCRVNKLQIVFFSMKRANSTNLMRMRSVILKMKINLSGSGGRCGVSHSTRSKVNSKMARTSSASSRTLPQLYQT